MEYKFEELNVENTNYINGGALGGAVAGTIFGTCAGATIGTVAYITSDKKDLNTIWKATTSTALAAGGIGAILPI